MKTRVLSVIALLLWVGVEARSQTVSIANHDDNGATFCNYQLTNFTGFNYALTDPCTGWFPAMLDMAFHTSTAWRATSSSSQNCTTGSKSFGIVGGAGFGVGAPARIVDNVDTAEVMQGTVTAIDFTGMSMTVNVTSVDCTGTSADWTIYHATSEKTIVATPVSIADGGTGSTSAAGARISMEAPAVYVIKHASVQPPSSPTLGDRHLVDAPFGIAFGTWTAGVLGGDIAEWDGGQWITYATPVDGDIVVAVESDVTGFFVPSVWVRNSGDDSPDTEEYSDVWPVDNRLYLPIDSANGSASSDDYRSVSTFIVVGNGTFTWTLAGDAGDNTCHGCRLLFKNPGTGTLSLNVEGSGTIDGVACSTACETLPPGDAIELVYSPLSQGVGDYFVVNRLDEP